MKIDVVLEVGRVGISVGNHLKIGLSLTVLSNGNLRSELLSFSFTFFSFVFKLLKSVGFESESFLDKL